MSLNQKLAFIEGTEEWVPQVSVSGMDGVLSMPQVMVESQTLTSSQNEKIGTAGAVPTSSGVSDELEIEFEVVAVYSGSNDGFDLYDTLQPLFDEPDPLWIHLLGNYDRMFLPLRPEKQVEPAAATSPYPNAPDEVALSSGSLTVLVFVAIASVGLAVGAAVNGVRTYNLFERGEELHSDGGDFMMDGDDGMMQMCPPTETVTGEDDDYYDDEDANDGGDMGIINDDGDDGMTVYDENGAAIQPHERPEDNASGYYYASSTADYDFRNDTGGNNYHTDPYGQHSQHYDHQRDAEEDLGGRRLSSSSSRMRRSSSRNSKTRDDTEVVHQMMEREDSIGDIFRSNYYNRSSSQNPDPPSAASEVNYPYEPRDSSSRQQYGNSKKYTSSKNRAPSTASSAYDQPDTRDDERHYGGDSRSRRQQNHYRNQSIVSDGARSQETSLFSSLVSNPKSNNESSQHQLGARPLNHYSQQEQQQSQQYEDSLLGNRHGGLYDVFAPAGQIGIIVDTTKDGPAVHSLKSNSPMLGLINPGDLIVGLDDQDTRAFTAATLTRLMAKKAHQKERKITLLAVE